MRDFFRFFFRDFFRFTPVIFFPRRPSRGGGPGPGRRDARQQFEPTQPKIIVEPFGTPPFFPDFPTDIPRAPLPGPSPLIGLGGLVVIATDILIRKIEEKQKRDIDRVLREQDAEIADINVKAAADRARAQAELRVEKRVQELLRAPELFDVTDVPSPLKLPQPVRLPQRLPGIVITPDFGLPDLVGLPQIVVQPVFVPTPTLPVPRTIPGAPVPDPVSLPVPQTKPFEFPRPIIDQPFPAPVGDPVTPTLTPVNDPLLQSPQLRTPSQFFQDPLTLAFEQPFEQPFSDTPTDTPADEKCKRKCDEQEKRSECFKGLYREGVSSTSFTEWQRIDCFTGADVN